MRTRLIAFGLIALPPTIGTAPAFLRPLTCASSIQPATMVYVFICKKEGSSWKATSTTDEGVSAEAKSFPALEDELKEVSNPLDNWKCPPSFSFYELPPSFALHTSCLHSMRLCLTFTLHDCLAILTISFFFSFAPRRLSGRMPTLRACSPSTTRS